MKTACKFSTFTVRRASGFTVSSGLIFVMFLCNLASPWLIMSTDLTVLLAIVPSGPGGMQRQIIQSTETYLANTFPLQEESNFIFPLSLGANAKTLHSSRRTDRSHEGAVDVPSHTLHFSQRFGFIN